MLLLEFCDQLSRSLALSTHKAALTDVTSLGDSGYSIIHSNSIFYTSPPQTHYFNCPLSVIAFSWNLMANITCSQTAVGSRERLLSRLAEHGRHTRSETPRWWHRRSLRTLLPSSLMFPLFNQFRRMVSRITSFPLKWSLPFVLLLHKQAKQKMNEYKIWPTTWSIMPNGAWVARGLPLLNVRF